MLGRKSPASATTPSRTPEKSRNPRVLMYASRSVMSETRPRNPLVPKLERGGVTTAKRDHHGFGTVAL